MTEPSVSGYLDNLVGLQLQMVAALNEFLELTEGDPVYVNRNTLLDFQKVIANFSFVLWELRDLLKARGL